MVARKSANRAPASGAAASAAAAAANDNDDDDVDAPPLAMATAGLAALDEPLDDGSPALLSCARSVGAYVALDIAGSASHCFFVFLYVAHKFFFERVLPLFTVRADR